LIFYTCITNDYDWVPDAYYDSSCRYVCFHDGSIETQKAPWEYVLLEEIEECFVRKSYHPKHLPHHYFDEGEFTVWIDASYPITKEFVEFSREMEEFDFTIQIHPDERTLFREFNKLCSYGFSEHSEILEMAKLMHSRGYRGEFYKQTINCVLWRRLTPEVIKWCNTWRDWYMGGVNRDQISSSMAEYLVPECKINRIPVQIDLSNSGRKKEYIQSYPITKPKNKDIVDLQNNLYKIFGFKDLVKNIIDKTIDNIPFEHGDEVKDLVVFTCVTNNYDEFPEDSYYDPNVRYVCFHDGKMDTRVGPWEYVELDLDIEDPRDFAFYVKANPHQFFSKGSNTVWIDGCFKLTKDFIDKSLKSFPFSVLRHGSKFSFLDELLEGYTCAFYPRIVVINFISELGKTDYNFKKYASPQCTIVWRTLDEQQREFDELWYDWGNRLLNRDTIPFDIARQLSGYEPQFYDNRNDSGIELGFFNKVGRRGKHPQHGNLDQFTTANNLLQDLQPITKLNPKLYAKYDKHGFYMKHYGIIN